MKHKHKPFDVARSPILPGMLPFLCMKDHAWVDLWRGIAIEPCLNCSNVHFFLFPYTELRISKCVLAYTLHSHKEMHIALLYWSLSNLAVQ